MKLILVAGLPMTGLQKFDLLLSIFSELPGFHNDGRILDDDDQEEGVQTRVGDALLFDILKNGKLEFLYDGHLATSLLHSQLIEGIEELCQSIINSTSKSEILNLFEDLEDFAMKILEDREVHLL